MKDNGGLDATRKKETRGRKSLGDTMFINLRVPGKLRKAIDTAAAKRGIHYSVLVREILEREYKITGA